MKEDLSRKKPVNLLLFFLFSCSYGYIVSCFANQVTPSVIVIETAVMAFLMYLYYLFNSFFEVKMKFVIISFVLIAIVNFLIVMNQESTIVAESAVSLLYYGISFIIINLVADEISKKYTASSKVSDFLLSPVQVFSVIIESIKCSNCCCCSEF